MASWHDEARHQLRVSAVNGASEVEATRRSQSSDRVVAGGLIAITLVGARWPASHSRLLASRSERGGPEAAGDHSGDENYRSAVGRVARASEISRDY
jgi:hypothetical protein